MFESNAQSLNQQVARAEEKISQLQSQKEKLVSTEAYIQLSSPREFDYLDATLATFMLYSLVGGEVIA